jgi:hypothetical protein
MGSNPIPLATLIVFMLAVFFCYLLNRREKSMRNGEVTKNQVLKKSIISTIHGVCINLVAGAVVEVPVGQ